MVTDAEIAEYAAFAERLADAATAVTLKYFRNPIDVVNKAAGEAFDPVTAADRDAEAIIRALITETYPDHGIFGEEHGQSTATLKNGPTWVIDPIDGTRAFISGLPLWGTLIALNDGTRPVIGLIDHPATGERFMGTPGQATGNRQPIKTRACTSLASAILSTTDPDLFLAGDERAAYDAVAAKVRLKRYGYDCYAYAMVAAGHLDLVIESGLQPYDVQAVIPVIEAAGGVMTSWSGGPADQGGQVIAAGDRRLHAAALDILRSAAKP
ncbi:histidinol-phosphatase [Govanella unica]|uniref:Histidinol-phosphatase n=1 Tax=Govanella unica TaxID=2975056 RepID=A0A9X3TW78_9PROT|nr:histidinol-phosphatase [Govania unica]